MAFPEPETERVEVDTARVTERHMYANGWGAEVTVHVTSGVLVMDGSLTVVVPRLKGWHVEWVPADEAGAVVPSVGYFDTDVTALWGSPEELEGLLQAVRGFDEYTHECDHSGHHCGSCDGWRCD